MLSVRNSNGYTVATISGELDIAYAPALRERLLGVLGPHASRIVVDLSEVTFCDASGLAVLVGVGRRAWLLGGVLRLTAPSPPVAAVLRLTGLDAHFEIFATVPAATGAPAHLGGLHPSMRRYVSRSQFPGASPRPSLTPSGRALS